MSLTQEQTEKEAHEHLMMTAAYGCGYQTMEQETE